MSKNKISFTDCQIEGTITIESDSALDVIWDKVIISNIKKPSIEESTS